MSPYLAHRIHRILGRSYDSIIRVNSQSGKGGVAYLLERDYQLLMPRRLQIEFRPEVVQAAADTTRQGTLTSQEIWAQCFMRSTCRPRGPLLYRTHQKLAASTDGADSERLALGSGARG